MIRSALMPGMLLLAVAFSDAHAQNESNQAAAVGLQPSSNEIPLVLGHGVDLFKVGPLLAHDDFDDLEHWVVQLQQRSGVQPARIEAEDNSLNCLVPGRGCTIWFKKRLSTRVTITYEVLCPETQPAIKGLHPRDINNFWMASDLSDPENGLFDSTRYTGAFGSYDKMQAYYASTGGRSNQTTRMRRYPREADGVPTAHLALNDKDEKADYLITPDKVMTVQLVAYDDVIQYIVDGKLVYQIRVGDKIYVEESDDHGQPTQRPAEYNLRRFPIYDEGYFGFRMVGTHHIYTNFNVYRLEPSKPKKGI